MRRLLSWFQWPYLFLLGAFNRDTPLGRILLIPVALIYCGLSWPRIMFRLHTGDKADKNQLSRNCWGFCDPALRWDREGSFSHRAMDFLAEWTKLSGQRTAKAGIFVILVAFGVGLVVGWVV